MKVLQSDVFGFIKPSLDAHTIGVNAVAEVLKDCGYKVLVADHEINAAVNNFRHEESRKKVFDWIKNNHISRVGFSFRLDEDEAVDLFGYLMYELEQGQMFHYQNGPIKDIYFAGLPRACELVKRKYKGFVKTFRGGEPLTQTLKTIGVPDSVIPKEIREGNRYDDFRLEFGKQIIDEGKYLSFKPVDRSGYPEFGTDRDTVVKRLEHNAKSPFYPLMRAHVGPYSAHMTREEMVQEFASWAKELAKGGYLDILSIGTSQLSQSNFGEDWGDKLNGGGVPINSPEEFRMIWEVSRPLLVRTYAGTKNIPQLAKIYEDTINISWHALSLWWFNKLDGRGPLDVYTNLKQHVETMKFIAETNKPFEPNIPHHFAFRGADDVTYIVSAYLAAKLAKKMGIRTLILQNMLNTPRSTWGIQDLAKSRALLRLVKQLEDDSYQVLLQPRAGLDYFSPDLYEAKIQLAAVSALMDDIDPHNEMSPPIIHVVSYSEASHLATPDIIHESIQITQYTIQKYRELRNAKKIEDMSQHKEVKDRENELYNAAKKIITAIETYIEDPYTAEGLYKIYAAGFLPTPYIWGEVDEFKHATVWKPKFVKGGIRLMNDKGELITTEDVIQYARDHIKDAEYTLATKYGVKKTNIEI